MMLKRRFRYEMLEQAIPAVKIFCGGSSETMKLSWRR
jgi:hypothetical protein